MGSNPSELLASFLMSPASRPSFDPAGRLPSSLSSSCLLCFSTTSAPFDKYTCGNLERMHRKHRQKNRKGKIAVMKALWNLASSVVTGEDVGARLGSGV